MNIVIFGGDFNPIHNGHLNMALSASAELDADVFFVPAKISVWKKESIDFSLKVKMIKNEIKGYSRLYIDEYENSTGKTTNYSIDTIKYFINKFPSANIYFLIGNDQVNSFDKWYKADEIASLIQIVYFSRPNYQLNLENVRKYKMKEIKGKEINISSSEIREGKRFDVCQDNFSLIEENELYFIKNVKALLSHKRYLHSLSVAHLAFKIAKSNKYKEADKAYLAGLFHDIGKDIPELETKKIMVEHFKKEIDMPKFSYHQFVGTFILKKYFKIFDKKILDAIKYHATGNKKMSTLAKIIYVSDKIEPTRGYDSSFMIEKCMENIKDGFILVLEENKEYLIAKEKEINNRYTDKCFDYYLKKL